jgi:hypothetical protein
VERREYIEGFGTVVATGALAGCSGSGTGNGGTGDGSDTDDGTDGSTAYGVLSTSITDQPNDIDDFSELVVTIQGIWVKPAGSEDDEDDSEEGEADEETDDEELSEGETDEETDDEDDQTGNETDDPTGSENVETDDEEAAEEGAGRYYIEFEEPQEADLVDLQGDNTQLIDETELEVGDYQFLQLDVSETNGLLTNDEEAEVETPGNAPLQFKQAFEIRAQERTRFIADFAPFRTSPPDSVRYRIRPVASGTRVLYGEGEADEGDAGDADEEQTGDAPDTDSNETENSTETSG